MIPKEEWLQRAKGIPVGTTDKVIHGFGCRSKRPAMSIYNDGDKWSCWCFACHDGGFENKQRPQLVQVKQKTGWVPNDIIPLTQAVASAPTEFRDIISMDKSLVNHITLLGASTSTGRIYYPDDTESFLGLDYTGKANARMYSPYGRKVAGWWPSADYIGPVLFTGYSDEYLLRVSEGSAAFLVLDWAGLNHALATLFKYLPHSDIKMGNGLSKRMQTEINPFT